MHFKRFRILPYNYHVWPYDTLWNKTIAKATIDRINCGTIPIEDVSWIPVYGHVASVMFFDGAKQKIAAPCLGFQTLVIVLMLQNDRHAAPVERGLLGMTPRAGRRLDHNRIVAPANTLLTRIGKKFRF